MLLFLLVTEKGNREGDQRLVLPKTEELPQQSAKRLVGHCNGRAYALVRDIRSLQFI